MGAWIKAAVLCISTLVCWYVISLTPPLGTLPQLYGAIAMFAWVLSPFLISTTARRILVYAIYIMFGVLIIRNLASMLGFSR